MYAMRQSRNMEVNRMPRVSTVKRLSPEAWQFALDNIGICIRQSKIEYEMSRLWESVGYTQEDLLSIAIMLVAEGADKYSDDRGKVSTFVYACVKNGFMKYSKLAKAYKRKADLFGDTLSYPIGEGEEFLPGELHDLANSFIRNDEIELIEDRIDLLTAIRDAELTRNEGNVLYHTCILGETVRATARKMNMSPQNVSHIRGSAARKIRKSHVYSEVAI